MKILMATQGIPSFKTPMYGIHQLEYARALKDFGIDVYLVSLDLRSIRRWRKWGYSKGLIDDIKYYNISVPLGNFSETVQMKYASKVLKKYFEEILEEEKDTDLVHGHFFNHSYPFVKVIKDRKIEIPIVISEHSSHVNKENIDDISKEKLEIGKYVYNNCNKLIVGSPYFRDILNKNFNVDSMVSPTVANTDAFTLDNPSFNKDIFKVVSTGNLIEDKGHYELINAFSEVFKDKNATLSIFGQGPEKTNLKRLIRNKQMEDKIFLKGHQSLYTINEEYNKSDLFVLASRHETYGKVYIEAMNSGLPIITVNNGGSEHFIRDFNGVVAKKNNKEDLANKLRLMYNNIKGFDKVRIRQFIDLNFSKKACIKDLKDIYSSVLKGD
ncbi:MAG: glycosyltransferase [Lagierella massiliensis]|nr:glycosyltransferase [Lagierella massiliensis]